MCHTPFVSAPTAVRLDKWLWAARVFKTRALATDACRQGRVTIAGQPAKPARDVKIGDILVVKKYEVTCTFKVLQLLDRRVGAPVAAQYVEDLTPPAEYEKPRQPDFRPLFVRPPGAGRPTKKERRALDSLFPEDSEFG